MTTKIKIAIGVGVLLLAGVAYARSRKPKLNCQYGFKPATPEDVAGYSKPVRDQVAMYGGYCIGKMVEIDYVGENGAITTPGQVPDPGDSNGPVTSPAALAYDFAAGLG